MYTPFYKTWWFRVIVIGALAVAAYYASYLPSYLRWREAMKPYDEQNQKIVEYYEYKEAEKDKREALYRADTYGGDTPEETLDLFIQALEAEDYELASKYFVPENQESARAGFRRSLEVDVLSDIILAYRSGTIEKTFFEISNTHNFYLIPKGEEIGYSFQIIQNEYTQKWKIEEF